MYWDVVMSFFLFGAKPHTESCPEESSSKDFRFRFAKDVAAVLRGDVSKMFPIVIALCRRYAGHKRLDTAGNQAAQDVPRCCTATEHVQLDQLRRRLPQTAQLA